MRLGSPGDVPTSNSANVIRILDGHFAVAVVGSIACAASPSSMARPYRQWHGKRRCAVIGSLTFPFNSIPFSEATLLWPS